jgi:hypothetical protein
MSESRARSRVPLAKRVGVLVAARLAYRTNGVSVAV